jgi:hypothetical protein
LTGGVRRAEREDERVREGIDTDRSAPQSCGRERRGAQAGVDRRGPPVRGCGRADAGVRARGWDSWADLG